MRTMYDSTTPGAIPKDATLIAAYVDGRETSGNYAQVQHLFPHAKIVKITVTGGTLDAHVADIETGDLSPQSGAAWAKRKVAAKWHPTLYCSADTWPAVIDAVKAQGIAGQVSYWIAHYGAKPVPPNGAVAIQYSDKGPHGENFDTSAVADYWPGVDAAPAAHGSPFIAQTHDALQAVLANIGTRNEPLTDEHGDRELAAKVQYQLARVLALH